MRTKFSHLVEVTFEVGKAIKNLYDLAELSDPDSASYRSFRAMRTSLLDMHERLDEHLRQESQMARNK